MDQEEEKLKHELEESNSEVDLLVEMAKELDDETQVGVTVGDIVIVGSSGVLVIVRSGEA